MKTTLSLGTPKQSVKKLLLALGERSRDIITKRYGLGKSSEQMTLDAIGKTYGITRESRTRLRIMRLPLFVSQRIIRKKNLLLMK